MRVSKVSAHYFRHRRRNQPGWMPRSAQLLAAAVGNCLSTPLLFALRKFKRAPEPLACTTQADVGPTARASCNRDAEI